MSASMPGGGKSANFELNLVPFIDLFSTLICFLLITAAWQNMETINTGAPPKSVENLEDNSPPPPPDPVKKTVLTVTLFADRIDTGEDEVIQSLPHVNGSPNYSGLAGILNDWKKKYPDRKDLILATDNRAPYKHLISLMDLFIERKFPEVGITLN